VAAGPRSWLRDTASTIRSAAACRAGLRFRRAKVTAVRDPNTLPWKDLGIDIALDFAIQASADHPWLSEHPEWFHRRPDGTLKYAENPPKRYQDIYNFNWESSDWRGLWQAFLQIVLQWVDCGVKVFRVDNPHTKPFEFWAWLIERVHARDRDVVFLAEAFTRRAVMRHLAKVGFSQSYTYFTWKNSRWELMEYVSELAYSGEQEYFRPNFFVNTQDILHAYLQHGGRPAFEARLVLASTLSPTYGIYSGFENVENVAVAEGSEEYLHSEKYEIKKRKLNGELLPLVRELNFIRRENSALHRFDNVTFLETANDGLIAYAKQSAGNTIVTVVKLHPHQPQKLSRPLRYLGAQTPRQLQRHSRVPLHRHVRKQPRLLDHITYIPPQSYPIPHRPVRRGHILPSRLRLGGKEEDQADEEVYVVAGRGVGSGGSGAWAGRPAGRARSQWAESAAWGIVQSG